MPYGSPTPTPGSFVEGFEPGGHDGGHDGGRIWVQIQTVMLPGGSAIAAPLHYRGLIPPYGDNSGANFGVLAAQYVKGALQTISVSDRLPLLDQNKGLNCCFPDEIVPVYFDTETAEYRVAMIGHGLIRNATNITGTVTLGTDGTFQLLDGNLATVGETVVALYQFGQNANLPNNSHVRVEYQLDKGRWLVVGRGC